MKNDRSLVVFLLGPTAVGKTEVSIELARKLDAEIISADSMQVYKGLNVGTSKPPLDIREEIPHHLIDVLDLSEEYSAARFCKMAEALIDEILTRRKLPLIVGGSGLYIKALVDGIFPGPGADWTLRKRLYAETEELGSEILYERLRKIDPRTASEIQPNDLRRIVRALEVCEKSGHPMSELKALTSGIASKLAVKLWGLTRPRDELYQRINARVDAMFEDGLLDEAGCLFSQKLSRSASQALGYKEIFGYLRGEYSLDEAKRLLKRDTRRFAKRQLSWFRQDKRVEWIEIKEGQTAKEVAQLITDQLTTHQLTN